MATKIKWEDANFLWNNNPYLWNEVEIVKKVVGQNIYPAQSRLLIIWLFGIRMEV